MSFTGVFKESSLFHDVMDYEKMAQNIIYYLENPVLIKKHQAENIEMIQKNYSLETVESNLKKLILKAK
jgi:glycosyltransferase involved in cell wall biosynthesis